MKAEMDAQGVITLSPETSVEAFALRQWASVAYVIQEDMDRHECGHWRSSRLMVNSAPDKEGA